jgi:F5/8 type C domain
MLAIAHNTPKWRSFFRAEKFGPTTAPGYKSFFETLIVVSACALVIYFFNRPAFEPFFLGEDFNAWTMYIAADKNFIKAIFTPIYTFLRPSAYAGILATQLVLPWDPLVHHWRNFLMLVLCVWILYRIMLRLTDRRSARLMAVAFFVVARVNFSAIGLINVVELLFTVAYALCALLFLLRYFQGGRIVDYCIGFGLFALCAFARDSNVMFFLVVAAMFALHGLELQQRGEPAHIPMLVQLLPFLLLVVAYVVVRMKLGVHPPPIGGDHPYALYFEFWHIASRLYYFLGNLGNLSFDLPGVTGQGDLAAWLHAPNAIRYAYYGVMVGTVFLTLFVALITCLRSDFAVVIPLIWAGALLAPSLLIGNRQSYYAFEPILALSLSMAMTFDRSVQIRPKLVPIWLCLLAFIGVNGFISSRIAEGPNYTWLWVTQRMAHLYKEVLVPNRGEPVTHLFIVADDDAGVRLLEYIVNPLVHFLPKLKKVPVLNVLMSPTVETFGSVKFSKFSLDQFLRFPGRTLVYRQGPTLDTYRDLTDRTVVIESVKAGGGAIPGHEPDKLFDRLTSQGEGTSWISNEAPRPHVITIKFAAATQLGSVRVVNPANSRLGELDVQVLSDSTWTTVYSKKDLQDEAEINAEWSDRDASAVRLIVNSSYRNGSPSSSDEIEEVVFPENKAIVLLGDQK